MAALTRAAAVDSIPPVHLDLERWPRRPAFDLFRGYAEPFFNLCAEVEVGPTRAHCRNAGLSFHLACWYACQEVVNGLEPFRYRLRGERVWIHPRIHVAMTVAGPEETFRFCHVPYAARFADFIAIAAEGERLDDRPEDDACIYGTTIPWLRFTSIAHARSGRHESVPKIAFGRVDGGRMPVSVEVHHALMDGIHAARFFERFEALLADPARTFG